MAVCSLARSSIRSFIRSFVERRKMSSVFMSERRERAFHKLLMAVNFCHCGGLMSGVVFRRPCDILFAKRRGGKSGWRINLSGLTTVGKKQPYFNPQGTTRNSAGVSLAGYESFVISWPDDASRSHRGDRSSRSREGIHLWRGWIYYFSFCPRGTFFFFFFLLLTQSSFGIRVEASEKTRRKACWMFSQLSNAIYVIAFSW